MAAATATEPTSWSPTTGRARLRRVAMLAGVGVDRQLMGAKCGVAALARQHVAGTAGAPRKRRRMGGSACPRAAGRAHTLGTSSLGPPPLVVSACARTAARTALRDAQGRLHRVGDGPGALRQDALADQDSGARPRDRGAPGAARPSARPPPRRRGRRAAAAPARRRRSVRGSEARERARASRGGSGQCRPAALIDSPATMTRSATALPPRSRKRVPGRPQLTRSSSSRAATWRLRSRVIALRR